MFLARSLAVPLSALLLGASLSGCRGGEEARSPVAEASAKAEAVKPEAAKAAKPASESGKAHAHCITPFSDEGEAEQITVGTREATRRGTTLTFASDSEEGQKPVVFGVLANLKEDTRENLVNVPRFIQHFRAQGAEAILVPGDVGQVQNGLVRLYSALAESELPVLVIPGNHEARDEYRAAFAEVEEKFSNVVDMTRIRLVRFGSAAVVSLPGYYDPRYLHDEERGCQYFKEDVEALAGIAQAAGQPVVLLSHAEPLGTGKGAIDAIRDGNAGDANLTALLRTAPIPFGVFANIQEAGGKATDLDSKGIPENTPADRLFLNPGMGDATAWSLNDGTVSHGMAATLKVFDGKAEYSIFRAQELKAEELPEDTATAELP